MEDVKENVAVAYTRIVLFYPIVFYYVCSTAKLNYVKS